MTPTEINKILTKVQGKCWHIEFSPGCTKCGIPLLDREILKANGADGVNPDFTLDTFEGHGHYGLFLEWAKGEKWFRDRFCIIQCMTLKLLTPSTGSRLIAEYLVESGRVKLEEI